MPRRVSLRLRRSWAANPLLMKLDYSCHPCDVYHTRSKMLFREPLRILYTHNQSIFLFYVCVCTFIFVCRFSIDYMLCSLLFIVCWFCVLVRPPAPSAQVRRGMHRGPQRPMVSAVRRGRVGGEGERSRQFGQLQRVLSGKHNSTDGRHVRWFILFRFPYT